MSFFVVLAAVVAIILYTAITEGSDPSQWKAIADGTVEDIWPPRRADTATVAGILSARWTEDSQLEGERLVSYTLVSEARVPGLRIHPEPRLEAVCNEVALGTASYGETLRLERKGISPPEGWPEDAVRLAVAAICSSRDYDEALDALRPIAREPRGALLLLPALLKHVEDHRVNALARSILSNKYAAKPQIPHAEWAALTARAACYLGDVHGLALSFTGKPELSEALDRRVGRALLAAAPDRAREVARQRLKEGSFRNLQILLELLAPPHLQASDAALIAYIVAGLASEEIRSLAIRRLGQLDTDAARAILVKQLRPHEALIEQIGEVLTPGGAGSLADLHALLKDGTNDEQRFAALWLGRLGTLEDVAPLAALRDRAMESSAVRDAAKAAALQIQSRSHGEAGAFSLTDGGDAGALSLAAPDDEGALSLTAGTTAGGGGAILKSQEGASE